MIDAKNREILVIEAGRTERHYWRDLWRYRELFYFLSWRDILVRYKQTAIGFAWALIRPLLTVLVFTLVFGKLARLPSQGVPYAILVCAAALPWQFFANAFAEAGSSLVSNANLISKVYFPRIIIPVSAVAVSLVDFLISLVILFALMGVYGYLPGWQILAMPAFLLLACCVAISAGVWVSALNVKYRDFRYIIPFIIQFGLFVSPVGFSSTIVPDVWRLVYALNPMVGVIEGFRWSITGARDEYLAYELFSSICVALVILLSGVGYFRKTERYFADVI